jgi:hypothetical protein
MASPVGTFALTEQVGSPLWDYGETITCTRTWEGPYAACALARPARGTVYSGLNVVRSTLSGKEGGVGRLVVVYESPNFPNSGGTTDEESYEIDWVYNTRDILTNPRYRVGGGGAKELTLFQVSTLSIWRNEQNAAQKAAYKYWDPENEYYVDLEGNALDAAEQILKGDELWDDYYPVARINSLKEAMPTITKAGRYTATKPFSACPDGYTWMKTSDRSTRSGKSGRWVRSVEWTGFGYVNTLLYSAAS